MNHSNNRFSIYLKNLKLHYQSNNAKNNNEESIIESLTNMIIDISDPKSMIDDLNITSEEIDTCLELIKEIDEHLVDGKEDEREDHRVVVVGWILTSIIIGKYKSIKEETKERIALQSRIASMYRSFIKFRTFRDVGKLACILKDRIDKHQMDNDLIYYLRKRLKFKLTKMINDIKNEKDVLFSLMGIRALVYNGNGWDCIDDILESDIVDIILSIANDTFNITIQNDDDGDGEQGEELRFKSMYIGKSKKYIHLVCNESSKVLINLTTTMNGIENIAKMNIIPTLFKMLKSWSDPKLKNILQCVLFMIGNITATKPEWRDSILNQHGLLKVIMEMGADPLVMSSLSDEISNIFGSITRCIDPPVEWNEIRNYMLPFVVKHFVPNPNAKRSVSKFIESISRHPDFDTSVISLNRLDQFVINCLQGDFDFYTEDWFFILECSLWTITINLEKGSRIFVFQKIVPCFKKIMATIDNYQVIDHIFYNMYDLIRLETSKENILNSKIIQTITNLILKVSNQKYNSSNNNNSNNNVNNQEKSNIHRLMDRKYCVDDPGVVQIIWNLLAILGGMSSEEIIECVEQGLLLLLVSLYPGIESKNTLELFADCLHLIIDTANQNDRLLIKYHLIELDFLNLQEKDQSIDPNGENIRYMKSFLIDDEIFIMNA